MNDEERFGDHIIAASRDAASPNDAAKARMRAGIGAALAVTTVASAAGAAKSASAGASAGKAVTTALAAKLLVPIAIVGAGAGAYGVSRYVEAEKAPIELREAPPANAKGAKRIAGGVKNGVAVASSGSEESEDEMTASEPAPSEPTASEPRVAEPVAAQPAAPVPAIAAQAMEVPRVTGERSRVATSPGSSARAPSATSPAPGASAEVAAPAVGVSREELSHLASVQTALRAGDFERVVTLAERYSAQFPASALIEDSEGARIVALCELGRATSVDRSYYFGRFPSSTVRARIDQACREKN